MTPWLNWANPDLGEVYRRLEELEVTIPHGTARSLVADAMRNIDDADRHIAKKLREDAE